MDKCIYMNRPNRKWIGVKWHNLTVLDEETRPDFVVCSCSCGEKVEVPFDRFKRGQIRSCGCEKPISMDEKAAFDKLLKTASKLVGRGKGKNVSVCADWLESKILFVDWALKHGYKPGLRLTRIDKSAGFEPSNCCWASANSAVGYVAIERDLRPTIEPFEESGGAIHVQINGGDATAIRGINDDGYKLSDPWDEIPMHDLTEREISKYFLEV